MGFLGNAAPPAFLGSLVFGTLLLITGLMVGIVVGRRLVAGSEQPLNEYHLLKLLRGMSHWTDGFADDVSRCRKMVDGLKEQMNATEQESLQSDPGGVRFLSLLVQTNDELQQRLERAERTLQEQAAEINSYMSEARTDILTGLPNRRVFDSELTRRIAEYRRHGTEISVLIVDVDYFKKINDRYGHLAGDAILAQVANVLRNTMRESDLVTRIGGEEFAILLPCTDSAEACRAAERARMAIEQAVYKYEGKLLRATISCGVANVDGSSDAQSVVKRADQALYASKSAGRNFAHWHDGLVPMPITSRKQQSMETTLVPANRDVRRDEYAKVCDQLRERLTAIVTPGA